MKPITEFVELEEYLINDELTGFLFAPWCHRLSPNLSSGAWINCMLMEGSKFGEDDQSKRTTPEFFASPYPVESWGDIWSIDINFIDAPGTLHDATNIIGVENGINILSSTVSPVQGGQAAVNVVADLSAYGSGANPDGGSGDRMEDASPSIQLLLDSITAGMMKEIGVLERRPLISARRLSELHLANKARKKILDEEDIIACQVVNGQFLLENADHNQYQRLWKRFSSWEGTMIGEADWPQEILRSEETGRPLVLLTSDTRESYLRFSAIPARKSYATVAITMTERAGRLRQCTNIIQAKGWNIVTAYQLLRKAGQYAVWRVMLESEIKMSEKDFRQEIRKALAPVGEGDAQFCLEFPRPECFSRDPHHSASGELLKALITVAQERIGTPPPTDFIHNFTSLTGNLGNRHKTNLLHNAFAKLGTPNLSWTILQELLDPRP